MISLDMTRGGWSFTLTKIADARLQEVWDRIAKEYGNGSTLDMAEGERIFARYAKAPTAGAR